MAIPDPIDTALERRFRRAQFLMSTPDHHKLPPDEGREVAFAGRSNAGKSSAINVICDQDNFHCVFAPRRGVIGESNGMEEHQTNSVPSNQGQ